MPGIVQYPQVVQDAVNIFHDLFVCEPERRHFAEYLTGLMVAERKTVLGINREFAETTDQSCLNKFLTEVKWNETELNERRLEWHQKDSNTRYSDRGVIPIDNVLIDHEGKFIKDVGWFWDHAEDRYKIAHDYLIVNYVCTSGKHYPLEFRCFKKRGQCEATQEKFVDHTDLFCELVDWVTNRVAWEVCRILQVYRHRWTGTETFHRDGKQELGMGDCQLRDGQGQTRHMYLVMLAYSLLMNQLRQDRAKEWALCRLTTIGEACRAMLRETLRTTLAWTIEQVTEYSCSYDHVVTKLRLG